MYEGDEVRLAGSPVEEEFVETSESLTSPQESVWYQASRRADRVYVIIEGIFDDVCEKLGRQAQQWQVCRDHCA